MCAMPLIGGCYTITRALDVGGIRAWHLLMFSRGSQGHC